jgi:parallel beta-helix repeat protein
MLTESSQKMAVLFIGLIVFYMVGANSMAMGDIPMKMGRISAIIEDNELYQNNLPGIRIRGSIPVTVRGCKIYSNGTAGIFIDRHSQVVVHDCDIFKNKMAGINIEGTSNTTIERNNIHTNKMAGVRILRGGEKESRVSKVEITNNRIYHNDQGGIRSMLQPGSKVDLAVIANDIYKNKKAGIRVENDTKLMARGNNVYDNGIAGIVSHVSVTPPALDIYQNRVNDNNGPGIHIVNGITGPIGIRNNWVFNNHRSGIVCGLWGNPNKRLLNVEITNNTIVSNGSSGQGAGVRNEGKGRVTIINNIIAYNYVTGIRARGCKGYSHNLLFANGDVGNCCKDPDFAPYWVERTQFAGCPDRGEGDLICDPLFVDPDNYDFHLRDQSPAIDAGKDTDGYKDIYFPPSKGMTRSDIGATGGPYASK